MDSKMDELIQKIHCLKSIFRLATQPASDTPRKSVTIERHDDSDSMLGSLHAKHGWFQEKSFNLSTVALVGILEASFCQVRWNVPLTWLKLNVRSHDSCPRPTAAKIWWKIMLKRLKNVLNVVGPFHYHWTRVRMSESLHHRHVYPQCVKAKARDKTVTRASMKRKGWRLW